MAKTWDIDGRLTAWRLYATLDLCYSRSMIYFYILTFDDPTHNQATWRHHVLFYMSWDDEGGGLWAWPCGLCTLPVGYFLSSVTPASWSRGVTASCSTCWTKAGKTVWVRAWTTGRLDDDHVPRDLCVTKNPHSPKVWSAAESSRGGRGGSQSRARSSLCLEGETLSQSLLLGTSAGNTGNTRNPLPPLSLSSCVPWPLEMLQTLVCH